MVAVRRVLLVGRRRAAAQARPARLRQTRVRLARGRGLSVMSARGCGQRSNVHRPHGRGAARAAWSGVGRGFGASRPPHRRLFDVMRDPHLLYSSVNFFPSVLASPASCLFPFSSFKHMLDLWRHPSSQPSPTECLPPSLSLSFSTPPLQTCRLISSLPLFQK